MSCRAHDLFDCTSFDCQLALMRCCCTQDMDGGEAAASSAQLGSCDLEQSSKLVCLLRMLPEIRKLGEKAVVVSTSTKMLDLAGSACKAASLVTARIDGSTAAHARQEPVNDFNAPNSSTSVRSGHCILRSARKLHGTDVP